MVWIQVRFTTDYEEFLASSPIDGHETVYIEPLYGDTDSFMPKLVWKQPSPLDDRLLFEEMMEASIRLSFLLCLFVRLTLET